MAASSSGQPGTIGIADTASAVSFFSSNGLGRVRLAPAASLITTSQITRPTTARSTVASGLARMKSPMVAPFDLPIMPVRSIPVPVHLNATRNGLAQMKELPTANS